MDLITRSILLWFLWRWSIDPWIREKRERVWNESSDFVASVGLGDEGMETTWRGCDENHGLFNDDYNDDDDCKLYLSAG